MSTSSAQPKTRGQLGDGIYSLEDLRLYLSYYAGDVETGGHALQWLEAALNPIAGHIAKRPDYAFTDLVSLFVVRELTMLGVKMSSIREAEQHLRQTTGLERPFVHREVMTDGRDVWITAEAPGQVEAASGRPGQHASHIALQAYLRSVQYTDSIASTWSPTDHVLVSPHLQFGDPVVRGTRTPTSAVAEIAESVGVELAASRLGLDAESAADAIRFEARLAALRN